MLRRLLTAVALAAPLLAPLAASAQNFPARPIHVIIPNEPGTLDFYGENQLCLGIMPRQAVASSTRGRDTPSTPRA